MERRRARCLLDACRLELRRQDRRRQEAAYRANQIALEWRKLQKESDRGSADASRRYSTRLPSALLGDSCLLLFVWSVSCSFTGKPRGSVVFRRRSHSSQRRLSTAGSALMSLHSMRSFDYVVAATAARLLLARLLYSIVRPSMRS